MHSVGIFHNFAEWDKVRKRGKNAIFFFFFFSSFLSFFHCFFLSLFICFFLFFFYTEFHVPHAGLELTIITEGDLELWIFLLPLFECWDYRLGRSYSVNVVLGSNPGLSSYWARILPTELHYPLPNVSFYKAIYHNCYRIDYSIINVGTNKRNVIS